MQPSNVQHKYAEHKVQKQTHDRSAQGARTSVHTSHASSQTFATTSCTTEQALTDQEKQPEKCGSPANLPNELPMSRSN